MKRNRNAMVINRRRAIRMFERGELTQTEIARQLRVSTSTVCNWLQQWEATGTLALGRWGRPPSLSSEQQSVVRDALRLEPDAHGLREGRWTGPKIAELVLRLTGVELNAEHLRTLFADAIPVTQARAACV